MVLNIFRFTKCPDPILGDFSEFFGDKGDRIFDIANPIIDLYEPTSKHLALYSITGQVVSLIGSFNFSSRNEGLRNGVLHLASLVTSTALSATNYLALCAIAGQVMLHLGSCSLSYLKEEDKELREKVLSLAWFVSSTALYFFSLRHAMILKHGFTMVEDITAMKEEYLNGEYKKVGIKFLGLIPTGISLGSWVFRMPEVFIASLVLRSFRKFYKAYQHQQKGKYLECMTSCFQGVILTAVTQEKISHVYNAEHLYESNSN